MYLFSDSCPGQNRNNLVATAMLTYMATTSETRFPLAVNIKFLESGHTNMECDSMHATIEQASKRAKICVPEDWSNVIRMAKKSGKPYAVDKVEHQNFIDFKSIQKEAYPNMKINADGNNVPWKKIKWLRFDKEKPNQAKSFTNCK